MSDAGDDEHAEGDRSDEDRDNRHRCRCEQASCSEAGPEHHPELVTDADPPADDRDEHVHPPQRNEYGHDLLLILTSLVAMRRIPILLSENRGSCQ